VVYLIPLDDMVPSGSVERAVIDQVGLRFVPSVVALPVGGIVEFPNSDTFVHNVFSPSGPDGGFDLGRYPRNERREHRFSEPGVYAILCDVHPEMLAYVIVLPTPYRSITDQDGRFRVERLPAGRYALRAWHRRARPFERLITVDPAARLTVSIRLAPGVGRLLADSAEPSR